MNVLAPSDTIMSRNTMALRRPYIRRSVGATIGTRAGPDGSASIPASSVTRRMPRRATAAACDVRHMTKRIRPTESAATVKPTIG